MLASLHAVARHRPGLYLLTAMTLVTALVCRTPLTIVSALAALSILTAFLTVTERILERTPPGAAASVPDSAGRS